MNLPKNMTATELTIRRLMAQGFIKKPNPDANAIQKPPISPVKNKDNHETRT